jgi:hypothetical protein
MSSHEAAQPASVQILQCCIHRPSCHTATTCGHHHSTIISTNCRPLQSHRPLPPPPVRPPTQPPTLLLLYVQPGVACNRFALNDACITHATKTITHATKTITVTTTDAFVHSCISFLLFLFLTLPWPQARQARKVTTSTLRQRCLLGTTTRPRERASALERRVGGRRAGRETLELE